MFKEVAPQYNANGCDQTYSSFRCAFNKTTILCLQKDHLANEIFQRTKK